MSISRQKLLDVSRLDKKATLRAQRYKSKGVTSRLPKLREEAKRLGLAPEDLARAALADLLSTPDAEFRAAAARILQKNQELYRRLA